MFINVLSIFMLCISVLKFWCYVLIRFLDNWLINVLITHFKRRMYWMYCIYWTYRTHWIYWIHWTSYWSHWVHDMQIHSRLFYSFNTFIFFIITHWTFQDLIIFPNKLFYLLFIKRYRGNWWNWRKRIN